ERVLEMHVPLVFFDRALQDLPFSSVTVDDRGGARLAVESLVSRGFRRIAHIGGSQATQIGRERRLGYEEAMAAHGIEIDPSLVVDGGFDERHGYAACRQIIAAGGQPDAIFCVSFPVGLGARAAMAELAPEMLDEVRLVCFGDGGIGDFHTYPHYCIRQPVRELGVRATTVLLEEIDAVYRGGDAMAPRYEV